jgi:hypothetical protein
MIAALAIGLLGFVEYGRSHAALWDDPLYRHTVCGGQGESLAVVEITPEGFRQHCVGTYVEHLRFVNRSEVPVTICLGHGGDCERGHHAPRELEQGIVVGPGDSRVLYFPTGKVRWGFENYRNYPITIGAANTRFPRPNLVVNLHQPQSPD